MANEYATLNELKTARRIPLVDTADDTALQSALTRASRAIDRRTGRRFWLDPTPVTRTGEISGSLVKYDDEYLLLTNDIGSVTPVTVETGTRSALTAIAEFDMYPGDAAEKGEPFTGVLAVCFPGRRWRITARWGWPAVPDDIAQATLLLANRRFMRVDSPEGVAGWNDQGPVRVSRFDPDIEDLVGPYVLPGFG